MPRKEEVLRHEIPETDLARANCLRTVLAAWEAGAIPSSKKVKKIRVYQCWVVMVESCAGDSEVKRNWRRVLNNKYQIRIEKMAGQEIPQPREQRAPFFFSKHFAPEIHAGRAVVARYPICKSC